MLKIEEESVISWKWASSEKAGIHNKDALMQDVLISNLDVTNAKQHFAHTISQTWQSGVKKKIQIGFCECDKSHCPI